MKVKLQECFEFICENYVMIVLGYIITLLALFLTVMLVCMLYSIARDCL